MAKIDGVREKINILRDDYRNIFIFFMAVLTGSFAVFFQVIIEKIALVYSLIGIAGVVVSLFILIRISKIKYDIDILIEEIGDLDE